MKTSLLTRGALLVMCLGIPAVATADTIYSGLQDTTIPTDFTGVFLTVDSGTINPFFGGVGIANDNLFQPVRSGTGNLDTIQNLAVGSTVDVSKWFSSGYGGSQDHLGTTFTAGQEGYLGFKTGNGNYGWMRVVLTGNTSGAVIRDWAYDDSGAAMTVGRVHQSAPSAGTQLVTLSPGTGESFTLGSAISDTGGNINSVLKTGGGATTVTNASYTGTTTVNDGRLVLANTTTFAGSDIAVNGGTTELHRTGSNWNLASAFSGNGAIEKTGSGDVTVTGTSNSFGGNVTVSSGGFFVAGSFGSVSSTISVGSGATFGGSGSTAAAVTVSGTLAPGPSIESLATGALTMNAGSAYSWGVGSDHNADLVQVSGLLSLAGVDLQLDAATLENLGINSWDVGDRLTLISYNGSAITSGFNGFDDDGIYTFGGNSWLFNYNDTNAGSNFTTDATGTNFVTLTVIPEPQAALIGGLGMFLLLRRRREK